MVAKFHVRAAPAIDGDGIAEAHIDSIRTLGARAYDPEVVDDWGAPRNGEIYRRAMQGGEVFFVAVQREPGRSERIIGFSSYRFERSTHRTAVYVRGDAARNGVRSALLTAAECAARHQGAQEINIVASLCAVEFYKANGFHELGVGEHALRSGKKMVCVFMRKQL